MKLIKILFPLLLLTSLSGCNKDTRVAKCSNGRFVGSVIQENGVIAFKGIPYAKAPVGDLRWKAPVAPDKSNKKINAFEYGKSSIQYNWHSEPIATEVSEDCLTLNVWTDSLSKKNKSVMVFFHGGAFAWGGSSEGYYDGQYIVDAHSDIVLVTANYRVGIMGFASFANVPGGEEYQAENLGVLDCAESLRWVKNNIKAFGGNPDNVTIFGESAGGGIVSSLLASEFAGDLFQHAIVESGPANEIITKEKSAKRTQNVEALMEVTGSETMADLLALTEEELIEANEYPLDEDGTCLNDVYRLPVAGIYPIAEDPYEALKTGPAKNVDIIIGTNKNELNYWVAEMGDIPMEEMDEDGVNENIDIYLNYFIQPQYDKIVETVTPEELVDINRYLEMTGFVDGWEYAQLLGDLSFWIPSVVMAEKHSESDGNGNTYMYMFEKENELFDFLGSPHAAELNYVFRNLKYNSSEGPINVGLADKMCNAWTNFAKTGNPSIENVEWKKYDTKDRATMIFSNECEVFNEYDPYSEERQLLMPLFHYNFIITGA